VWQFDTLRLRLVKIAARVEEMKTQIRLHLPAAWSACVCRASSLKPWGADAPE